MQQHRILFMDTKLSPCIRLADLRLFLFRLLKILVVCLCALKKVKLIDFARVSTHTKEQGRQNVFCIFSQKIISLLQLAVKTAVWSDDFFVFF